MPLVLPKSCACRGIADIASLRARPSSQGSPKLFYTFRCSYFLDLTWDCLQKVFRQWLICFFRGSLSGLWAEMSWAYLSAGVPPRMAATLLRVHASCQPEPTLVPHLLSSTLISHMFECKNACVWIHEISSSVKLQGSFNHPSLFAVCHFTYRRKFILPLLSWVPTWNVDM